MGRLKRHFSDFSVKSKLAVLIYIFIASTIIMGWVANFLFKTSQTVIVLVNEQRVYLEKFYHGIDGFYRFNLTGNIEELQKARTNFEEARAIAFTFAKIDSFIQNMPREEWVPKFYEIFKEGADYDIKKIELLGNQFYRFSKVSPAKIQETREIAHDAALLVENINALLNEYAREQTPEMLSVIQGEFSQLRKITSAFVTSVYEVNKYINNLLGLVILLLVVVLTSAGTFVALRISRSITEPVNRLADNFKNIALGNIKTTVDIHTKNEIGEMSKAFSEIQDSLRDVIRYSKSIAKGDFSQKLKPKSENDELTISLNKMAARLEDINNQNNKETWLQNGISGLDDQMRGNFTVRELSSRIIIWLSHSLKAEMGAVYVFDEVPGHLELTGSVGLNTSEINQIIKPGESLIGKAALQKELQVLNTKNRFLKVYSATGEISPERIYLLPLYFENRIQAVIELAPVNEFSELKIEFLKLVAEKISVNLGAAVARFRHKELLDITLEQAEELKARNEELKTQEEELRVANEEMKSQEEELRVANEELAEQTKILLEDEKRLHAQQKKLEEVNNDLKQVSQYKSEFLANMSHELRTPLNSLLILSKLLSENKKGNLNDDQLKSVKIIYKSGKDLLELINEILDLSKIEAGKMTYNFRHIATDELKMEIVQNFKLVAENKRLNLKVKISDDIPPVIYTDKQRLMQILKNLLSNAMKFTSEGYVNVHFGRPSDDVIFFNSDLNRKNTFYIAVKDSGIGIPPDKVNGIFEAFQQADGSISRQYGGTGLGLSISKQLIQALGGEIHIESTEGEGSVFTVYLPLDENMVGVGHEQPQETKIQMEQKQQKPNPPENKNPGETQKMENLPLFIDDDRYFKTDQLLILIIHNEKGKAQALLDLCHKRNFNGIVASGITDGIKLAAKFTPQAIIISDGLRDSQGLRKLKQNKFTRQLPLHLVSRVEDSVLDNIEDLATPESESFQNISNNIENKLGQEYKQVLVVEDDPVTRQAIHLLFEKKDMVLHEAKTGQQAYDMISNKSFDCVILDLGLPDFSGNELLRKLKENGVPIPHIIIHTARELSGQELHKLQKFSESIVIKGLKSDERLMDEVTLFLHQIANKAPKSKMVVSDEDTFKGKKVLVVDDDIRNVFAIAQILEEREIEVLEAENGAAALVMLKNNPGTDLVLMDIMMPVMNGYEAMQKIRSNPETENIPIITLSAKAMKEDYQKAIDSGANDYISKPVDVQKLLSLLKIWLYK